MAKEKDGNLQSRKNNLKFDYSTGDPPRKSICQRNWKQVHAKELRTWRRRSSTLRICLQTQARSGWEDGKLPTESGGRGVGWGLGRLLQGRREIDDESNGGGRGITVLVDGEGNGGVGNEEAGQQPAAGGAIPRSGVGKRIAIWGATGRNGAVGGVEAPWALGEGAGRAVSGRDRPRDRVWNTLFYTQGIQ